MNKRHVGTLFTNAKLGLRLLLAVSLITLTSACELIDKGSSPNIPKDNPGENASLPEGIPQGPGDNSHRLDTALRQTQTCGENLNCTQQDDGYLAYTYLPDGRLDTAEERETNSGSDIVSFRQYFYDAANPNRLDKVAVRETGNFHTLHDYTYDDENDPSDFLADVDDARDDNPNNDADGFNAKAITRPKLRLEYICDIDVADASNESCDRDSATEVIRYIYYADGLLYRKEFDVDNDTEIEHQKIYYYRNSLLTRVDTDNFYNGIVDERYYYEQDNFDSEEEATLRVFIDNGYLAKATRGIDRTVSYRLDTEGLIAQECYFRGELEGLLDRDQEEVSGACTTGSTQSYHWLFTWVANPCWAGGLDDIDPEARAIDYLCKQGG